MDIPLRLETSGTALPAPDVRIYAATYSDHDGRNCGLSPLAGGAQSRHGRRDSRNVDSEASTTRDGLTIFQPRPPHEGHRSAACSTSLDMR